MIQKYKLFIKLRFDRFGKSLYETELELKILHVLFRKIELHFVLYTVFFSNNCCLILDQLLLFSVCHVFFIFTFPEEIT